MNWEVFITCAVTGAGDTTGASDRVPVTPEQIADARSRRRAPGAAVVHIHVRDPDDRQRRARPGAVPRGRRADPRVADVDVVLNLTAGMGGDLVLGGAERAAAARRRRHRHGRRDRAARPRRGAAARRSARSTAAR